MHCTNCGKELDGGTAFCNHCGAPTAPGDQQRAQPGAQRKSHAIPIAIAVIVVVAIVAAVTVWLFADHNDAKSVTGSVNASISAQAASPTFENGLFRITLPSSLADKVRFSEEGDALILRGTASNESFVAELCPQSDLPEYETEYKQKTYTLGEAYVSGGSKLIYLTLPYVNAEGKFVHAATKDSVTLGITQYLDMTPEEFAACIELKTESGFKPAVLSSMDGSSAASSQQSAASGVPSSAFWGIWAQASKDKAEMEAVAQRMKSDHGLDAFVVLTTDWSNLNNEPWYCVSLGSYASKEAADAALSKARSAYADAYVKYSGDRQ